jgi:hypothetical protein
MLTDGDYDYTVVYPGYSDEAGSVTVAGAAMTVEVEMILIEFDVTFHVTSEGADIENALVTIEADQMLTGPDGTTVFTLQDGEYLYSVSKDGFVELYDFFIVAGSDLLIEVELELETTNITFHVTSGGANINNASVTIGGNTQQTNSNGNTVFVLPNGDYDYTVTKLGYEDEMGSITVASVPQTIEVVLDPVLYDVTFHVTTGGSDLEGAEVTVNGMTNTTGANGNAMFNLSNGTYSYTVVKLGYDTETGTVTVNNGAVTKEVEMFLTEWQITIHVVSGGTAVSGADVTIDGTTVVTGGTGNAVFDLVNGDYDYEVVKDGYETENGTFTVNNAAQVVEVVLTPIPYDITFHVTSGGADLEGADVTIAGNTVTTGSNGEALFSLINGTYTYNVTKDGYMPEAGSITVASAAQTVEVELEEMTYEITFVVTVSGQPLQGASVTVDGTTLVTPANGTVVFDLVNGTYMYEVTHPDYGTADGEFTVNNAAQTIQILIDAVGEIGSNMFSIYPNPSNGKFNISSEELVNSDMDITVYDFTGKVVVKNHFNGNEINTIDLTGQEEGMYMMQIIIDNKVINKTLIVK